MATLSHQLNISTYYESFLVLSLCLRIGKRQLKIETSRGNQLPVLRYRDVSFTSEYLKDSLSAVCPLMGVHNVARVRQGALPLFEVDFTEEKALDKFCRSLSNGTVYVRIDSCVARCRHLYIVLCICTISLTPKNHYPVRVCAAGLISVWFRVYIKNVCFISCRS